MKRYHWAVLENIVTLVVMLIGCWYVSGWFALLVLNINDVRFTENSVSK